MWQSWPQEWQLPLVAAKGSPVSSCIGSASISARSSSVWPAPLPTMQLMPALPTRSGESP